MINFLSIDYLINQLILQLNFGHFAEVYILSYHYYMFLFCIKLEEISPVCTDLP